MKVVKEVGLTLQKTLPVISAKAFSNDELTQVYKLDETRTSSVSFGLGLGLQTALDTMCIKQRQPEELIFYVGKPQGRVGS